MDFAGVYAEPKKNLIPSNTPNYLGEIVPDPQNTEYVIFSDLSAGGCIGLCAQNKYDDRSPLGVNNGALGIEYSDRKYNYSIDISEDVHYYEFTLTATRGYTITIDSINFK